MNAKVVLFQHGKSFWLASQFLSRAVREDAAVLYAFCRWVDDLADLAPDPQAARASLRQVEEALVASSLGRSPIEEGPAPLVALSRVAQARGLDLGPAVELVRAVTSDLEAPRVRDDEGLLRYCYGVAGTVGLLMSPLLGVRDSRAHPFAVDLGVAMQLTNLCRDVLEDARLGRVYLPASRLEARGLRGTAAAAAALACAPTGAAREAVRGVVLDLLTLADRYYGSAREGLRFIPFRERLGIAVAGQVYRAIGRRLRSAQAGDPLAGRVVVPWLERFAAAALGVRDAVLATLAPPGETRHETALHRALVGLPGAAR